MLYFINLSIYIRTCFNINSIYVGPDATEVTANLPNDDVSVPWIDEDTTAEEGK